MPQLPNRSQHEKEVEGAVWYVMQQQQRAIAADPMTLPWDEWEGQTVDRLKGPLADTYEAAYTQLATEKKQDFDTDKVKGLAVIWALLYAGELGREITAATRDRVTAAIQAADAGGVVGQNGTTSASYRKRLKAELAKAFPPGRASTLGVTEVTRTITQGKKAAAEAWTAAAIIDHTRPKTLAVPHWEVHPEKSESGTCDVCQPLEAMPEWAWPSFARGGPPIHPRCKCELDWREIPIDQVPASFR